MGPRPELEGGVVGRFCVLHSVLMEGVQAQNNHGGRNPGQPLEICSAGL